MREPISLDRLSGVLHLLSLCHVQWCKYRVVRRSRLSIEACRYEVRHVSGVGQRSPPRGGVDPQAPNQQLLVDEDNDDDLPASEAAGSPVTCITIGTVCRLANGQHLA